MTPPNCGTTTPQVLGTRSLDELLAPVADLIGDPHHCNLEIPLILERLVYLSTRGPARDGRKEMLQTIATRAVVLYLAEFRDPDKYDPIMAMVERVLTLYIVHGHYSDRSAETMRQILFEQKTHTLESLDELSVLSDETPNLIAVARALGVDELTSRLMYALLAEPTEHSASK